MEPPSNPFTNPHPRLNASMPQRTTQHTTSSNSMENSTLQRLNTSSGLSSSNTATVNKAYQYTYITSVTILYCSTIPWVIILTWIFIGTRYSLWQLIGALLCVVGLCVVLFSDTRSRGGGSKPIFGDVLVIAGVLFHGISNVGVEFVLREKIVLKYFACLVFLDS